MNTITPTNAYKFGTQFRTTHSFNNFSKYEKAIQEKPVFFKIIVPNYNNMPYIKKCLDSILEQTFQDFKIIVIDDLSTDLSDKLSQSYANKWPDKIVYLSTGKKLYAGGARNIGLKYSLKSEYTIFIDSDDWLYDKNILQSLYDFIQHNNYPMMIRAPMLNYYGKVKQSFIDKLSISSKIKIYRDGPGPGRTIISSKLTHTFIENRLKNNDCIWFLKCLDSIKLSQIKLYPKVWYVYNRISITSCQNSSDKINNIDYIYDSTVRFIDDIKQVQFNDEECNKIKTWEINRKSTYINFTNQISQQDLFSTSYVITCKKEEYDDFCNLFTSYKISPLPKAFAGCVDKKLFSNSWRIRQSHINLVEYAKKLNLPFVLIFESDAYPCIDIVDKLNKYLKYFPSNANIILLGWTKIRNIQKIEQTWSQQPQPFIKITKEIVDGAHSYVIFNKAYDKWLYLMSTRKSNNAKDNYIYPADDYIFKDIGNTYMINYPLFIQYNKSLSTHNHLSYNFNGCSNIPPKGFK